MSDIDNQIEAYQSQQEWAFQLVSLIRERFSSGAVEIKLDATDVLSVKPIKK